MTRRLLVWGTFDTGKPRVRMLLQAIRTLDPEARVLHHFPWRGIEDKSQLSAAGWMRIGLRWIVAYPTLLWAFLRAPRHDVVLVPYPGLIDVLLLWPLARLRGSRICWDMFISAYDTAVLDRQMLSEQGLAARIVKAVEWLATRAADMVILDTNSHADYIAELYGLPAKKVRSVWVGVEDELFQRAPNPPIPGPARVLFYGQFIPLHGLPVLIEAIDLIAQHPGNQQMEFTIVGSGQEDTKIDRMIASRGLTDIRRIRWVEYEQLPALIAASSICLGVFAPAGKAARVIPNKVFQILAVGRPLVTMDSPAIREIVSPGPAIRLVTPGDPAALAQALIDLASDLQHEAGALALHRAANNDMPRAGNVCVTRQLQQALEAA